MYIDITPKISYASLYYFGLRNSIFSYLRVNIPACRQTGVLLVFLIINAN